MVTVRGVIGPGRPAPLPPPRQAGAFLHRCVAARILVLAMVTGPACTRSSVTTRPSPRPGRTTAVGAARAAAPADGEAPTPDPLTRTLAEGITAAQRCYVGLLATDPALGARLVATLDVAPKGEVLSVEITPARGAPAVPAALGACVREAFLALRFEPGDEGLLLEVPLRFRPAPPPER